MVSQSMFFLNWILLLNIFNHEIQPCCCMNQYFIPLCCYMHYSVDIPQCTHLFICWWDIRAVSSLGQLWIKLLWIFMYKSFCGCMFSSLIQISRGEIAGLHGKCNFIKNSVFQSGCTILHFHQQYMSTKVHILFSSWYCQSFWF